MTFKPNDLERLLLNKFQFSYSPNKADDHIWFELKLDNLPPITTKVSHGNKEIGSKLKSKMARQLHVKVNFFDEMFRCTKNKEQFERQIRTNPFPPFD